MAQARLNFDANQPYGFPQEARFIPCEDFDYMEYDTYDAAEKGMRETDGIVSQIKRQKATRSY